MKNGRVGAEGALRLAGKLRLQATSKRMLLFQRFHIKVRLSLAYIKLGYLKSKNRRALPNVGSAHGGFTYSVFQSAFSVAKLRFIKQQVGSLTCN